MIFRSLFFIVGLLFSTASYSSDFVFSCEFQDKWRHYTFLLEENGIWPVGSMVLAEGGHNSDIGYQEQECHSSPTHVVCTKVIHAGTSNATQCGYATYIYKQASAYEMTISYTDCSNFNGKYILDHLKCTKYSGALKSLPR